eukprot:m.126353 g.126353  ORF g.126353 m.126353 type:complete len:59 (+) comp13831_c0_seq2:1464-1640(+)
MRSTDDTSIIRRGRGLFGLFQRETLHISNGSHAHPATFTCLSIVGHAHRGKRTCATLR